MVIPAIRSGGMIVFLVACVGTTDGVPGDLDGGVPDSGAPDGAPIADGSIEPDGGDDDAGPAPDGGRPPPNEIFFVGNSFTFGGPVPDLVHDLAVYAGFPEPNVEYRAIGGQTLQGHRADAAPDGAPARVAEGWDVVVLQELSTRPTDSIGPAEQFEEDATWFYDLAKTANADCEVILYETWARRSTHEYYPDTFADPADMQAQLRYWYNDAVDRYIPMFSTADRKTDVRLARAGDAWELVLAMGEPPRLHADDDYHASASGQYLNALVIYGTIYRRRTLGLVPIRVDEATAARLQTEADRVTGATLDGPSMEIVALAIGDGVRVDFGPTSIDAWPAITAPAGTIGPLLSDAGSPTSVRVTAMGFTGVQTGGAMVNELGYPPEVSSDSLWVGSFDGHAAALPLRGYVVLRGLAPGTYEIEIFASRDGDDGGIGRLTRYAVGDESTDLDVADNTRETAALVATASEEGEIVLEVSVSPEGAARFGYLGALLVTRLD
jgi:hypothetical protein